MIPGGFYGFHIELDWRPLEPLVITGEVAAAFAAIAAACKWHDCPVTNQCFAEVDGQCMFCDAVRP